MKFIENDCIFSALSADIIAKAQPFTCGKDSDMDEFFRKDALKYIHYHMGRSYCFRLKADQTKIVACFTVANDSIRIYDLPNSRKNMVWGLTDREKMLSRYPGVLIGRLAVAEEFAGRGIGSEILDFIKTWFLDDLYQSGCRLAIVDAVNKPEVLQFYQKNGFITLFSTELQEDLYTKPPKDEQERLERINNPRHLNTRLMFCDLLDFYEVQ